MIVNVGHYICFQNNWVFRPDAGWNRNDLNRTYFSFSFCVCAWVKFKLIAFLFEAPALPRLSLFKQLEAIRKMKPGCMVHGPPADHISWAHFICSLSLSSMAGDEQTKEKVTKQGRKVELGWDQFWILNEHLFNSSTWWPRHLTAPPPADRRKARLGWV